MHRCWSEHTICSMKQDFILLQMFDVRWLSGKIFQFSNTVYMVCSLALRVGQCTATFRFVLIQILGIRKRKNIFLQNRRWVWKRKYFNSWRAGNAVNGSVSTDGSCWKHFKCICDCWNLSSYTETQDEILGTFKNNFLHCQRRKWRKHEGRSWKIARWENWRNWGISSCEITSGVFRQHVWFDLARWDFSCV